MRFLADMGVSPRVVEWLRAAGHKATHLREEGLQRLPDDKVFTKAITEQRIVLTFDLDFGEIVAYCRASAASVVIFRMVDTRTEPVILRLRAVLHESEAALAAGSVVVIEDGSHRVRRLPAT